MASSPAFIGVPKGTDWTITLTNQTGTRAGTPPTAGLILTAGSSGAFIESIQAKPLGTNVATVLFIYVQNTGGGYYLIGEKALPATTDPGLATDTGMGATDCSSVMPVVLFPAAAPATPNRGIRVAPNNKIYVALGTAVAAGWVITMNGGDI